ncbi:MAG TPA: cytochrome P450 [Streptosporangiaceae bacterium]|jgi:cytochrome P450|nr:cytochrome P450 [Streptosporangiaceae bacterium]
MDDVQVSLSAPEVKAEFERLLHLLVSPQSRDDPYPVYASLREVAPVYLGTSTAYLFGYDDCQAIIRNPGLGAQSPAWMDRVRPDWREHPGLVATHESFVFRDPPDHTRLRRHVSGDFSQSRVRVWRDYIAEVTGQVLDQIDDAGAGGGQVDLHEILATSLPIRVISKVMGVPESDHPMLRVPLEGLRLAADGSPVSKLPVIDKAGSDLMSYFADLVAQRREAPRDDLVSSLASIRDSGGAGQPDDAVLSEEEMLQSLTLIFSAAIESMADLLLNGTAAFIAHPDQAAALRGDPSLVTGAVEEAMRFDAPVQAIGRIAAHDLELGGVAIPDGTYVLGFIGAGNRDPDRFPEPDDFDITRPGPAPLSLSGGAHFCLGAALARLEAAAFFPALLARFPALEFAEPPVRRGFVLRGFASFPVTVR